MSHLKRNVHASMLRQKQVTFPCKEESRIDAAHSGMVDIHHHVLKSTTSFMGSSAYVNARNLTGCSGAELPLGLWLEYSDNE